MSVRVRESTQPAAPRRRGPGWLLLVLPVVMIIAAGFLALTYDTSGDSGEKSSGGGQPVGAGDDADKPSADLSLSPSASPVPHQNGPIPHAPRPAADRASSPRPGPHAPPTP